MKLLVADWIFWHAANQTPKQTLRFVKSLPKRERQPLANKFKNADPDGAFANASYARIRTSANLLYSH